MIEWLLRNSITDFLYHLEWGGREDLDFVEQISFPWFPPNKLSEVKPVLHIQVLSKGKDISSFNYLVKYGMISVYMQTYSHISSTVKQPNLCLIIKACKCFNHISKLKM